MKLLKCKLCSGEMDIVGNERAINRKVKCRQCGYNNESETNYKGPEVVILRKRIPQE
jgi:uncharacterized Zn finger protein